MTTSPTTSAKPDSPPPPYAALPSTGQNSSLPHDLEHGPGHVYGPTPLNMQQQQLVLPYYDPSSPHAMAEAVSRARWRFFVAMLWAFGIWTAFGIVTGGIVVDIHRT